ncbi:MAG: hypothetical protein LBK66_05100 [Spirochaetaceae bacterium]|jgi:hypothetical protein|nr:hypothetical protein [Spirochaetaceae bacterium]
MKKLLPTSKNKFSKMFSSHSPGKNYETIFKKIYIVNTPSGIRMGGFMRKRVAPLRSHLERDMVFFGMTE